MSKDKTDNKKKNKKSAVIFAVIAVLAALICSWKVYVNDYYHALDSAETAISQPADDISVTVNSDGSVVFEGHNAQDGIVFYPGAKVEYKAYAPLLSSLAEKGYFCVLIKMPQNMAIFDIDAAKGMAEKYPDIRHWYIAGHSMGGAMAAVYISKHADEYDGLILLGAYSTADLTGKGINVLSIRGSEDQVCSRDDYDRYKDNLPESGSADSESPGSDNDYSDGSLTEYVIEGGCHAYYGCYGLQKGDGTPGITNEEQIEETADEISAWIEGLKLE